MQQVVDRVVRALGYARAAVTREARYTRYVDDGRVLRSHTTALVPPALRALAADPVADVLLVCPGVVYQLDLWRVARRPLTGTDVIGTVLDAVLPGATARCEPRVHP